MPGHKPLINICLCVHAAVFLWTFDTRLRQNGTFIVIHNDLANRGTGNSKRSKLRSTRKHRDAEKRSQAKKIGNLPHVRPRSFKDVPRSSLLKDNSFKIF